jgi:hypothetical protein
MLDGLNRAIKAYGEAFNNLDELLHPALVEKPDFPVFLLEAVSTGKPWTRDDAEHRFGPVSWDW